MTSVSVSGMRDELAELLNRVAYNHERVRIDRHGKTVAVLVPVEDAELLDQLEDRLDLEAARAALKEKKSLPWTQVKARLGLS
jgi:prevent-host-death family protein